MESPVWLKIAFGSNLFPFFVDSPSQMNFTASFQAKN
jgi:hypothetical protein